MAKSVTILEKPLPHISLADWYSRATQIKNTSEARRNDAFCLRHAARNMRYETNIKTDWDTYHTNSSLSDRVAELNRWHTTMVECNKRVEHETALLNEEKASTERELEAMVVPLNVVLECLSMRDCRLGSEITYDEGDTELKKELCIIENNKLLLENQCQAAWEKLNRLSDVHFKLGLEIDNKNDAQEIDIQQLGLDKFCANITFKPDALRTPKNACSYEEWLGYTNHLKLLADNELEDTYAMRESLFVSREKARNVLKAQQERTEHTIRKRIFETQRARNELEWQKLKTKEEMENFNRELQRLEKAYENKTDALKLAETRLENRAQRSGMELCCDEAHKALCEEVMQLRRTRKQLMDKINCAKTAYNALEEQATLMDIDLNNKEHSLMTDLRGIDLRMRLKTGEFAEPKTQTDRNIVLTRMEKEIPPE